MVVGKLASVVRELGGDEFDEEGTDGETLRVLLALACPPLQQTKNLHEMIWLRGLALPQKLDV